ncbi:hypothetical protein MSMTP_0317 [Methanosarcina sp. MTP4]|uniref:hypothetical protein n=1 Tax=Methanosarcina sp. MTP4 TaxID=1434100 RepID=UPI00061620C6|nr:hypothetical protein [Methanosarcina sp. MTP4]AKB23786.1 hypothetical protein MSMTP_0317 [Methanosarcina sp. MTP4]
MNDNEITKEIERLTAEGINLLLKIDNLKINEVLIHSLDYQNWYTESLAIVRQLFPERAQEFIEFYELKKTSDDFNLDCYTIKDFFRGITFTTWGGKEVFDPKNSFRINFMQQIGILNSLKPLIEKKLSYIRGLLKAELYDSEIDKARDLYDKGFLRSAGVIAGVILEGHLNSMCENYNIIVGKKNPTLSDYNEALKRENIIDVPLWRHILWLGDVRNLCAHQKEREPKPEEVLKLIDDVSEFISTSDSAFDLGKI